MDDSLATFTDPPREFSVLPFWFWNDELDAEEIRRQIGDFGAHGVHGFVILPCVGRRGGEIVYVVPEGAEHSGKAVVRRRIRLDAPYLLVSWSKHWDPPYSIVCPFQPNFQPVQVIPVQVSFML